MILVKLVESLTKNDLTVTVFVDSSNMWYAISTNASKVQKNLDGMIFCTNIK